MCTMCRVLWLLLFLLLLPKDGSGLQIRILVHVIKGPKTKLKVRVNTIGMMVLVGMCWSKNRKKVQTTWTFYIQQSGYLSN